MTNANGTAVPDGAARFFRYTATVTDAVKLEYPKDKDVGRIPWPFLYAGLAAINNELLALTKEEMANPNGPALRTTRSRLIRKLTGVRWFGTEPQLRDLLDDFHKLGLITHPGNEMRVLPPLLRYLDVHAKAIFHFMTGQQDCQNASVQDWLQLNHSVFEKFFFGEYGDAWRAFRHVINGRLSKKPANVRKRNVDFIDADPSLWVATNSVAIAGSLDAWDSGAQIKALGLGFLAGDPTLFQKNLEKLKKLSIIVIKDNSYVIGPAYAEAAERLRSSAEQGLNAIKLACEEWKTLHC